MREHATSTNPSKSQTPTATVSVPVANAPNARQVTSSMRLEYVPRLMTVANLFQLLTRNAWTVTQVTGSVPQESAFKSFKKSVMSTVQSGTVQYAKDAALVRLLTLMGSV